MDDVQVRKKLKMLKNHANVAAELGQVSLFAGYFCVVHKNLARLHGFKAVHGFDQRGFSRTGRPAYHNNLALVYARATVAQHIEVTVPLGYVFQNDHGFIVGINH